MVGAGANIQAAPDSGALTVDGSAPKIESDAGLKTCCALADSKAWKDPKKPPTTSSALACRNIKE
jgi:hypothetical protein